jgi:hypothetical protein
MKETSKFIDSIYLRFFKVIAFFPSTAWCYEYCNMKRSFSQSQSFNELLRHFMGFLFNGSVSVFNRFLIEPLQNVSFHMAHFPDLLKLIPFLNKNHIISKKKMAALGDLAVIHTSPSRLP